MPEQDFQLFANAANANVISQSDYLASNWLTTGFSQGIAYSDQLNKVWRQSSIITSVIAQTIADVLGVAVIDDGTIATIEANFIALFHALNRIFAIDTGTLNSMVITLPVSQAPASMAAITGVPVIIKVSNTNTAAVTLNIDGLGATPVVNPDKSTLTAGQLIAGALATAVYDGTYFELMSIVTGPLTGKANTWSLPQTWSGVGTFQSSITVASSATAASLVSTGAVSAAAGALVTGYDANGANLRTIGGNYGALIRNDGVSCYLLQTASGSQYGASNAWRPFSWNFTSGAVTIDGTGLGTSFGGPVSVAGALSAASTLAVTGATTSSAYTASGLDASGAGQFRADYGTYGVIFRNDGTNFYMLQTASGSPTGTYNAYRPLRWTLATGIVYLDGTGAGVNTGGALSVGTTLTTGGAANVNGAIGSNGNITASNGRLRASFGAYNSADPNAAAILNDWLISYQGINVGYTRNPAGVIDQVIAASVPSGGGLQTTIVTLPIAYPNGIFDAIISFLGNNPPSAAGNICVQPYSKSQVSVTSNYQDSATLGVVIRSRGN